MSDETEEQVSIVDKFCDGAGLDDETRESIRGFWNFFYKNYGVFNRTELNLLRKLFIHCAQYVGSTKSAPEVIQFAKPQGVSRGDLFRSMQAQAGVCQEYYNAINERDIRDINDAIENSQGNTPSEEVGGDSGDDVGSELLDMLDDGDVDGDTATEEVPEVRDGSPGETGGDDNSDQPKPRKQVKLSDLPPTQPA